MVKVPRKSVDEKPLRKQCDDLAKEIMIAVRTKGVSRGVYKQDDVEGWRETVEQDRRSQNLTGLQGMYDSVEKAVASVQDMQYEYNDRINAALQRGVFTDNEANFSKRCFGEVDVKTRQKMLATINDHIDTSKKLLEDFEEHLIKELLSDEEVSRFTSKFKGAGYEKREVILSKLIRTIEARSQQVGAWKVVQKFVEATEGTISDTWLKSNMQRLESLKNIPIFLKILKTLKEKIDNNKNAIASGALEHTSQVPGTPGNSDYDEINGKDDVSENTSKAKEEKLTVVAKALISLDKNTSNVVTDNAIEVVEKEIKIDDQDINEAMRDEIKAETSVMEQEGRELNNDNIQTNAVSEFERQINRAFKNDPEIAPTGLKMLGADKHTTARFMGVVTEVREGSVRQVEAVIQKLKNSSVNVSIFTVDHKEEEYELVA